VFATTPFSFEGENRQRNARGIMSMIEDAANATFFLPLDKLISGEDGMDDAMRRAVDTVASGVTLFWRLVEKPGYIRLDTERLRHILADAGRGRFAAVSVQGPNRVSEAIDRLIRSEMLATASGPVNSILCGVLAGEDLRLSEVGAVADGIRSAFGERHSFELATVNDETTFCGRLAVVVMLFETGRSPADAEKSSGVMSGRRKRERSPLGTGPAGRGRFKNAEPTIWNGEDLDIPTFIRRNINLEF
jgi:cell division protein FtsZ